MNLTEFRRKTLFEDNEEVDAKSCLSLPFVPRLANTELMLRPGSQVNEDYRHLTEQLVQQCSPFS